MASTRSRSGRTALFWILILGVCAFLAGVAWLGRDGDDGSSEQGPADDLGRTSPALPIEAPPDASARAREQEFAGTPVDPPSVVESKPADDSWRQARLDELDRMYASLVQLGPDSTIVDTLDLYTFFWLTIAPQMDARGEYEELVPFARTRIERKPDEHVFTFRQRVYHVPIGAYPEFDEFVAFLQNAGGSPSAVPSPDSKPPAFHVDQAYLDRLALQMRTAQAVIRERTDPY